MKRLHFFSIPKPIWWISLAAIVSMTGCQSFPEEQSKPYFKLQIDTVTSLSGVILEGDSILFSGSIASRASENSFHFGINRGLDQPYDYAGPDSDFVFHEVIQTNGKILESITTHGVVPPGIRPGNYICFGFAQEQGGSKSDSAKLTLFIRNPFYPEMVLDTPFNGLMANHRIDSANWVNDQKEFRFQIRSFAERMERIELQWYDSLKATSIDDVMVHNVASVSGIATLNRLLMFPGRKGRKFYLRSVAATIDNRSLISWIPFERNFAYP
ncbi:MAG TPA: hypothetical protein PLK63_04915 [Catalimonadaceae bacterium]|nr:hypothetical protein [Catalimonadaceae bacterium]